ncbi:MAG TPA: ABC transporter permease subunit [Candidatus Limiplasma sp.]|nr:ABC transporter permease subunit [Candidatus Limiplasma sp.]HRX08948.1 ABC transporter permease subunit [Candidatus Limiplasma sp.]
MNATLYKREMKSSWKLLVIFSAILTMYTVLMIVMYTPEMLQMFQQFSQTMPQLMNSFNMDFSSESLTLLGYLASGLYGFILIIFPMIFSIIRGNGLVARYVDRGSMASLLAAPVKRRTVALTQMGVLLTGIVWLVVYVTGLELFTIAMHAQEQANTWTLLKMNFGLLSLHLFIGGVCFLASCIFDESRFSIALGAGLPGLMFILQMLAQAGETTKGFKYATFFTLYNPDTIAAGEAGAMGGVWVLLAGAVVLFAAAVTVFTRRDLSI